MDWFEIFDLGIFWGRQIAHFSLSGRGEGGTLDLSRDFSGIQNNLKFLGSACVSRACRSANKVQRVMSFFVPAIFSDFVGNPRDFFLGGGGVGFFSPFDHVRHLKSGLLNLFSWLSVLCTVTYILSHFPYPLGTWEIYAAI